MEEEQQTESLKQVKKFLQKCSTIVRAVDVVVLDEFRRKEPAVTTESDETAKPVILAESRGNAFASYRHRGEERMPVASPSQSKAAMSGQEGSHHALHLAVRNAVSGGAVGVASNHLTQLPPNQSLVDLVAKLTTHWRLPGAPEDYSLKLESSGGGRGASGAAINEDGRYITEGDRATLRDGAILKLCQSPRRLVADVVALLAKSESNAAVTEECYRSLAALAQDDVTAVELVRSGVLWDVILPAATAGSPPTSGAALVALAEVLRQDEMVSWDDPRLTGELSEAAASIASAPTCDPKARTACLAILEGLASEASASERRQETRKLVHVPSLLGLLREEREPQVQQSALALLNALFRSADRDQKRLLKQVRTCWSTLFKCSCIPSRLWKSEAREGSCWTP